MGVPYDNIINDLRNSRQLGYVGLVNCLFCYCIWECETKLHCTRLSLLLKLLYLLISKGSQQVTGEP